MSHQQRQDPQKRRAKQNDLEMLQLAAAAGEIDLLYTDESGCCLWSAASYSYYFKGEQKRQEQTKKRGKLPTPAGIVATVRLLCLRLGLGELEKRRLHPTDGEASPGGR